MLNKCLDEDSLYDSRTKSGVGNTNGAQIWYSSIFGGKTKEL